MTRVRLLVGMVLIVVGGLVVTALGGMLMRWSTGVIDTSRDLPADAPALHSTGVAVMGHLMSDIEVAAA